MPRNRKAQKGRWVQASPNNARVGCSCRVRLDLQANPMFRPSSGWGWIAKDEVGVITEYSGFRRVIVKFPSQRGWMALIEEMEIILEG